MSLRDMAWAWDQQDLRPPEKLTLLALANHSDAEHVCWPSITRISREAGVSIRSVTGALNGLEQRGLIQREHQQRPESRARFNNRYVLQSPEPIAPYSIYMEPPAIPMAPPAPPLWNDVPDPMAPVAKEPSQVTNQEKPVKKPKRSGALRITTVDEPFTLLMIERYGARLGGEEGVRDSISLALDNAHKKGYHDEQAAVRNWLAGDRRLKQTEQGNGAHQHVPNGREYDHDPDDIAALGHSRP